MEGVTEGHINGNTEKVIQAYTNKASLQKDIERHAQEIQVATHQLR
jgi:hypothetical protein